MSLLKTLAKATPEQLKSLQPFSTMRAINEVENNPEAEFKLLDIEPRYEKRTYEGKSSEKVGFVFECNGHEYFLKFGEVKNASDIKENQKYGYAIREYQGTRYVVVI